MLIYPYKVGSSSVRELKKALGCKVLRLTPSKYKDSPEKIILNWGSSKCPYKLSKIVNKPENVAIASNKIESFKRLTNTVPWTTNIEIAEGWITDEKLVVCRTIVSGYGGKGIVLAESHDQLVAAPLYTQYVKKSAEYRVHVFCGKVIHVQEKRKRKGEAVNHKIRNHENGWVFCTNGVDILEEGKTAAVQAIEELGLDFGAVDLIYNKHHQKYYVLEVNTAPGLVGTTIQKYKEAIYENYPIS